MAELSGEDTTAQPEAGRSADQVLRSLHLPTAYQRVDRLFYDQTLDVEYTNITGEVVQAGVKMDYFKETPVVVKEGNAIDPHVTSSESGLMEIPATKNPEGRLSFVDREGRIFSAYTRRLGRNKDKHVVRSSMREAKEMDPADLRRATHEILYEMKRKYIEQKNPKLLPKLAPMRPLVRGRS
jgi:hypothetical protein